MKSLRFSTRVAAAVLVAAWAVGELAFAQVYPYFPPPGMTYNGATGAIGTTGPITFPALTPPAAPASGSVVLFGAASSATNITQLSTKDNFGGQLALGYEQHMVVANQTGGTIAAGNAVYITGANGSGVPTIGLAKADSATTLPAVGYTQYAITNGGTGELHVSGNVGAFTIGFSAGGKLYLSDSVAGALTATAPTAATSYVQQMGVATVIGGSGAFQLAPQTPVVVARAVTGGGTGLTTLPVHTVLLGEGTSNVGNVAAMAADTLLQGQGTGADPAAVALINCGSSSQALAYSTSTHTFSCQTISGGASLTQVFKSANQTRTTTAPTADPDLIFTSVPAGNHALNCLIMWTNAATTANLRYGIEALGTIVVGIFNGINANPANGLVSSGATTGPIQGTSSAWSQGVAAIGSAGANASVIIRASVVTSTTGDIVFGWAEQSVDATNGTTVYQGSWCQLS
jgi:hypothetical protein